MFAYADGQRPGLDEDGGSTVQLAPRRQHHHCDRSGDHDLAEDGKNVPGQVRSVGSGVLPAAPARERG